MVQEGVEVPAGRPIFSFQINPLAFPGVKPGLCPSARDFGEISLEPLRSRAQPPCPVLGRDRLPAGRQGLILNFDKLSVLRLSAEAALLTPSYGMGLGAIEVSTHSDGVPASN